VARRPTPWQLSLQYVKYTCHRYSLAMDFRRPLRVVTPTLDGDVLSVLAGAEAEMTGRELQRVIGHGSHQGVRNAADRLAEQGVVSRRSAGNANLYQLNRDHVAAAWIEGLASLPAQVLDRLRAAINGWEQRPVLVVLFGSVARGEATPESDLDLLVVRPADCDADEPAWQEQISALQAHASAWTGNDARVLEFGEQEITDGDPQQVLTDAARDGIELYGTLRLLRRSFRAHSTR
jgi:Nucleotidyltransferase domain